MNKHVLFLDIDGVLNNGESIRSKENRNVIFEDCPVGYRSRLNAECVALVNRLVREASCDVVLSSVWRIIHPWEVTSRYFQEECGCEFPLIGATDHSWKPYGRGAEIQKWRTDNDDVRPFIILDDSSGRDMDPHQDRLIKTDSELGLQVADVEAALSILCMTP